MLWVLLAIIGAISNAAYYIIIRNHIADRDPRILTALGFSLAGFLLLAISAARGFPVIGASLYSAVVLSGILNIVGLILVFRAMESSDLSLSMPMLSFTPAFLIGTSYLLLGEVPSEVGVLGICIIVGGSYVLNISTEHEHFLDPIRSMVRNRGSWYMLVVAFLFAISINFDKIAMLNSDPTFGMAFTLLIVSGAFTVILLLSSMSAEKRLFESPGNVRISGVMDGRLAPGIRDYIVPAFLTGIFAAAECVSINVAYTLQIAPYVIAIKRLSVIFMVLYGTLVCGENELNTRIPGSVLMVIGAVIILLSAQGPSGIHG